jgi:hypothetical protein
MNSFTTRILGQTAGGELLFYSQLKTHHSKLVTGYFPLIHHQKVKKGHFGVNSVAKLQ